MFFFLLGQHTVGAGERADSYGDRFLSFPLLGPEPQNPFCVIRSRRSYGKLMKLR